VPFAVAGGWHIILVWAMRQDPDYDAVLFYSIRYKSHYDAG
jgi:type IV secretory pathway TrbD component